MIYQKNNNNFAQRKQPCSLSQCCPYHLLRDLPQYTPTGFCPVVKTINKNHAHGILFRCTYSIPKYCLFILSQKTVMSLYVCMCERQCMCAFAYEWRYIICDDMCKFEKKCWFKQYFRYAAEYACALITTYIDVLISLHVLVSVCKCDVYHDALFTRTTIQIW